MLSISSKSTMRLPARDAAASHHQAPTIAPSPSAGPSPQSVSISPWDFKALAKGLSPNASDPRTTTGSASTTSGGSRCRSTTPHTPRRSVTCCARGTVALRSEVGASAYFLVPNQVGAGVAHLSDKKAAAPADAGRRRGSHAAEVVAGERFLVYDLVGIFHRFTEEKDAGRDPGSTPPCNRPSAVMPPSG